MDAVGKNRMPSKRVGCICIRYARDTLERFSLTVLVTNCHGDIKFCHPERFVYMLHRTVCHSPDWLTEPRSVAARIWGAWCGECLRLAFEACYHHQCCAYVSTQRNVQYSLSMSALAADCFTSVLRFARWSWQGSWLLLANFPGNTAGAAASNPADNLGSVRCDGHLGRVELNRDPVGD